MSCNIAVSAAAMMSLWAGLSETCCEPLTCPGKHVRGGRYGHQTNYIFTEYFSTLEANVSDK